MAVNVVDEYMGQEKYKHFDAKHYLWYFYGEADHETITTYQEILVQFKDKSLKILEFGGGPAYFATNADYCSKSIRDCIYTLCCRTGWKFSSGCCEEIQEHSIGDPQSSIIISEEEAKYEETAIMNLRNISEQPFQMLFIVTYVLNQQLRKDLKVLVILFTVQIALKVFAKV